jgi:hypothetical protein
MVVVLSPDEIDVESNTSFKCKRLQQMRDHLG